MMTGRLIFQFNPSLEGLDSGTNISWWCFQSFDNFLFVWITLACRRQGFIQVHTIQRRDLFIRLF